MYPSSSSSSSQNSMGSTGPGGLIRYGSAPCSLLTTAVDSVIGTDRDFSSIGSHQPPLNPYFSGDSESTCKVNASTGPNESRGSLQRSYGLNEFATASDLKSSSSLVRQRSSPAGFFSHLTPDNGGFSVTTGTGSYISHGSSNGGHGVSRLKPQLSFSRQDSLSQISEVSDNVVDNVHQNARHSYAPSSFGMDSWDNGNSIVFSSPPNKRAKNIDGDFFNSLNALESQFSLPQTTLEMAAVENLLHIPEDSVPCKVRAKRGCATHPRSIAERERRTRISGKLKKLQELVPNMDKQTSYSDMLDLAVQHIKGLQNKVQNLHKELEHCTCGCKQSA